MPIQNIRVKVSRKYSQLYKELTSEKLPVRTKPAFEQHRDLYLLCCSIGFRTTESKPLDKSEDLFWSHTMDIYQESVLRTIAINSGKDFNLELVSNDTEIIRISEGYAEKGMEVLIEKVLLEYITEEEGRFIIEYNDKSFLQKDILSFVQSEYKKTPFDY
jgi:hypothetical protein